jgi:hypothetical protein
VNEKPKINYSKLVQVDEGKPYRWYKRKNGTYVEASVCCDCSLTHIVQLTPTKKYLNVRVWREDIKTKELRAKSKKK